MKFCKVGDIQDWQQPEFPITAAELQLTVRNRKSWEFIQLYNGLKELGLLNDTSRGLGLGVGHERLIYALTNQCGEVVATDLYNSQQWSTASMATDEVYHANPFPYRRDRLLVRHMDMTQIEFPDNSFDFIWSCCAVEHVNNFKDLHRVYEEMHRVLKPGGIAALTTEFNSTEIPSYEPNMLFTDRIWVETWLTGDNPLIQGFEVLGGVDLTMTDMPENHPIFRSKAGQEIQVYCNDVVLNVVSFFLRKHGDFTRSYDENWLPAYWQTYLAACDRYRDGQFAESERLLKEVLNTPLESRLKLRALRRLADALLAQTKLDEFRSVCLEAFPYYKDVRDEDQLVPLAHYCKRLECWEEASTLYATVAQLPSALLDTVIQCLIGQAECLKQQKKYAQALEILNQAEQKNATLQPGHPSRQYKIEFQRGFCCEKLGQWEQAIAAYNRAIETAPEEAGFRTNCYRRLSKALQKQVDQLKEKLHQVESAELTLQQTKFYKLYSGLRSLKGVFTGKRA